MTEAMTNDMDIQIPPPGGPALEADGVVRLKIKRQDSPGTVAYWQVFEVPAWPSMNVIECLMEIRRNPVDADGRETTPVVWSMTCLEEVCGSCTMLINGRVGQSCSTLVQDLKQPISLEPMSKFPVRRDLVIDRQRLFDAYRRVTGWIPIDGTHDLGSGPRMDDRDREDGYWLARCMSCACCIEACPQVTPDLESEDGNESTFVGAAPISLARLMNLHPTGNGQAPERYEALMGPGGISACAKSMNCIEVCPKEIPLVESIASMNRQVSRHLLVDWLKE